MQEQVAASNETARGAKRQLMVRGAVVGALLLALLGTLVILERRPETTEEPAVTARTVTPPTPRIEAPASSPLADSAKELVAQSADAPDATNAALASEPVATASAPQAVPEETMDPTVPILGVPNKTPNNATRQPSKPAETIPAGPRLTLGSEPAVKPAAPKQEAKPVTVKDGFVVQLGVFSDYANAEQLHKKLTAVGIASHLETRVQVGPFKSRQEALAAQTQLKKMGLDGGMVVVGHAPR